MRVALCLLVLCSVAAAEESVTIDFLKLKSEDVALDIYTLQAMGYQVTEGKWELNGVEQEGTTTEVLERAYANMIVEHRRAMAEQKLRSDWTKILSFWINQLPAETLRQTEAVINQPKVLPEKTEEKPETEPEQ